MVVLLEPFHLTVEQPFTKFVPITIRVNPASPAVLLVGLILVVVGTGLVAGLIVNVWALEVNPAPDAGLKTVTLAVPAVAMSEADMDAVSCVRAKKVVVRSEPFHLTTSR